MARKRMKKNGKKNRRYRSHKPKLLELTRVNNSPIPLMKTVKLKYFTNGELGYTYSTGVNSSFALFRVNSPYDPDYSNQGSNVSCKWYSMYLGATAGLYNYYKVLNSKWKITIMPNEATVAGFAVAVLPTIAGFTQAQTLSDYASNPGCISKFSNNIGYDEKSWSKTFNISPWRALGVPKSQYMGDLDFGANYNANPGQVPHLGIITGAIDDSSLGGGSNINFAVELELTVRLMYPHYV